MMHSFVKENTTSHGTIFPSLSHLAKMTVKQADFQGLRPESEVRCRPTKGLISPTTNTHTDDSRGSQYKHCSPQATCDPDSSHTWWELAAWYSLPLALAWARTTTQGSVTPNLPWKTTKNTPNTQKSTFIFNANYLHYLKLLYTAHRQTGHLNFTWKYTKHPSTTYYLVSPGTLWRGDITAATLNI